MEHSVKDMHVLKHGRTLSAPIGLALHSGRNNFGSFAILTAIRHASSRKGEKKYLDRYLWFEAHLFRSSAGSIRFPS